VDAGSALASAQKEVGAPYRSPAGHLLTVCEICSSTIRENGRPNGTDVTSISQTGATSRGSFDLDALRIDPDGDLFGFEAHILANLDEWDPALGDESAHEPLLDAQPVGQILDIEERRAQRFTVPLRSRTSPLKYSHVTARYVGRHGTP
jgi:hypothetical protein